MDGKYIDRAEAALEARVGTSEGEGDWFAITQPLVDAFAELTHDHQYIHVDPVRAAASSPWGGTVAHGFLTLAMLTHLTSSLPVQYRDLEGMETGINYGFDRVRFLSPVRVGSRIRASSTLVAVERRDASIQVTRQVTVGVQGEERPACVVQWLARLLFRDN